MKKYKQLLDVILLLGLATIALLAIAPKTFVMPSSVQMLILAAVLGLIATFLVLFWREQPDDEREMHNRTYSSKPASQSRSSNPHSTSGNDSNKNYCPTHQGR
jgi:hypothetical protein